MNRKIWKALGIAVCMLALAAPRAMAETHVHTVTADTNFAEVVKTINASKDEGEHVIELHDDITLKDNYILTNGKTTTIKGKEGEDRKISINGSKDLNAGITVTGEGTVLNLGVNGYDKKLTIDKDPGDGSVPENTRGAFITVSGGATVNMYGNVTLQNWQFAGNACVVVKGLKPVTGPNSAFNMYGGVIENCSRAVIAYSWATFHMFDGEIKKCKADGDDVISVTDNSKFIMEGGIISECKADTGGGLYAKNKSTITINKGTISGCTAGTGGGLYADNSTINITGGTISGCEGRWGGGLYATNQSTITINNGTISGCTAKEKGGGLYATNQSTINITGGIISGCKASLGVGGGLYAENSSTITISDGTISGSTISGCTASAGGGLYATNSSEITISDSTIKGNEAAFSGGGLYVDGSTITINNGTISECTAAMNEGGGLYATNSSKITISGGTISECSTTLDTGKGGGLYAENSTITISGGTIKDNEAAHGGGVALTNSTVTGEQPIRNWSVVGNKAYKTGGGIWLGEKVEWDISDRTKQIYNNQAIEQGADIFLEGGTSAIKLPNAANMGAKYHDSGINIDNWYNDNPRYTPSENGQVVEANKLLNGGLSLVASYKADPVRIEIDANGGVGGSGSQTVQKGTNVTLEAPTKEGHLFKGWKDEKGNSYPAGEDGKVSITVTGDMTLTAEWKKLPSAENLPKTGDESPVLLWGAALAVSAAACFVLRRKK